MSAHTSAPAVSAAHASRLEAFIAGLSIVAITLHLALRHLWHADPFLANIPLFTAFVLGGTPLVWDLARKLLAREFGSDLLAGISIVTSVLLGEYLAGTLVILMLSGGEALEAYAVRSASSVLHALAKRMPTTAHRKGREGREDVALDAIEVGDILVVLPHEICPVDGTVVDGRGVMDESYLTGEPYQISKTPGVAVLSGAINGESMLTIRADRRAVDSRYAKIMEVMKQSEQQRPKMRRLADSLGAWYTPLAVLVGIAAWILSGDPVRFLAVMVVATPCPLLIAIPVAIIGSISLAAKRAIIIRDPVVLEKLDTCRTVIFDKTGTLTYGEPALTDQLCAPGFEPREVLAAVAGVEIYSKHPLATAIVKHARDEGIQWHEASQASERPGEGLLACVNGREVRVTSRRQLLMRVPEALALLPEQAAGLECVIEIDGRYAATYRFRDAPRGDSVDFVSHLMPHHQISRTMIVSGDRASEVAYLAEQVGIQIVEAEKSPEEKLQIVRNETARANTVYVGDGINDAPALMAATVGIAFGTNSDVTSEAAGAVIMTSSLRKVDELMHIGRRMRRIALQSAIGGMAVSIIGMFVAAAGHLPPVTGAITQEIIDVVAVANALRVAFAPKSLTDF